MCVCVFVCQDSKGRARSRGLRFAEIVGSNSAGECSVFFLSDFSATGRSLARRSPVESACATVERSENERKKRSRV